MASMPVVLLRVLQWLHERTGGTAKLNVSLGLLGTIVIYVNFSTWLNS